MPVTLPWVLRRALWAVLLLFGGLAAQAQHHSPAPASTDRPGTHGMLVFGTTRVFASHLPMFHGPHHYQVVLELTLSDSAKAVYQASWQQFPGETVYTLEPEQFVLPEMVRQPRPFRATLYRGHFERGGTPIARQITVRIKQVLYFEQLNPKARPKPAVLLVGQGFEQFLLHRIAGRPDFDQVVQLREQARVGLRAWTEPLLQLFYTKAAKQPLQAGQDLLLRPAAGGEVSARRVTRSLYLEHDDLR
ncbi:hypothetical protein E5K00_06640 [Hymenobacter aquaticus]|uniref:DUF3108 domain-containing protein n=1 Tax=Hymenobacter aquaticus TaxID=1867101 RepID=A0A4Z0Q846_9BACT|nr:hypothetical protein [Hymenobacter aquaticus]TGE24872.1 hypothetical protein E5K00_06640 [Hymenobacter aquaticus]